MIIKIGLILIFFINIFLLVYICKYTKKLDELLGIEKNNRKMILQNKFILEKINEDILSKAQDGFSKTKDKVQDRVSKDNDLIEKIMDKNEEEKKSSILNVINNENAEEIINEVLREYLV